MKQAVFETKSGVSLLIKHKKSAVILELDGESDEINFKFEFTPEVFQKLINHIITAAHESWSSIVPREANSMGSDYDEYYDRKLDRNGYLSFSVKEGYLLVERPTREDNRLYQFSKRKMESFIFDYYEWGGVEV
ncbi:hypothetical protein [Listeria booriae]|uniref:hypothetical protein n=1 Tax=Listeria booriae TaxID=1552123 RepID=UPI00163D7FCD|nr:hypothetical protein [Listeria booriae]MBC1307917.1 hypothetical protein [Listeria booriae]